MNAIYNPQTDLFTGIDRLFPLERLPWDDYYLRMAQTDFLSGRNAKQGTKTFFFRQAPFRGSFAIFGGLTAFLRSVSQLRFDPDTAEALVDMGYRREFADFLVRKDRLALKVFAVPEGGVVWPNEPVVVLEGPLVDLRIGEGILLEAVNYPTLSMTKWNRVVQAAAPGMVMEFARRRAQNALKTSLYAYLAGCHVSSNAEIRRGFDIPVTGTMGHEWVQSIGDEYESFDLWLQYNPDRPVLLVDTIDTLRSGLPNAIRAFKKHWDRIRQADGRPGIRNDSGDLAYLTIAERSALDAEGLGEVRIFETNDLDEYLIQSIRSQITAHIRRDGRDPAAVIDRIVWAAGTMPGTCWDQPSIGGVAKLTSIGDDALRQKAVIKIAKDNIAKTSIPCSNRSAWVWEGDELLCCLIYERGEDPCAIRRAYHPADETKFLDLDPSRLRFETRQVPAYDSLDGRETFHALARPSLADVRARVAAETDRLHWTTRRLENPHQVKVSLSPAVFELRQRLIRKNQLIDDDSPYS